tara:strand:+ start:9 stop:545 length:537 start_codon:yes stop_codon:yes gene_type:complete
MRKCTLILILIINGFISEGQICNIIYVDASSELALFKRDEWQESLAETLKSLEVFETLVFLSNQKNPILSTPDDYTNAVKQLGRIRPSQPLVDDDLRLMVKVLDRYSLKGDIKVIVYTSSEAFQRNVEHDRLLYQRICYILAETANEIQLDYYLHSSDTTNITVQPTSLNITQTTNYF